MYFRQFYLGCLALASYLIGSGTEAAVIDPQRDIDIYLEDAMTHGLFEQFGFRNVPNVVGGLSARNNAKLALAS